MAFISGVYRAAVRVVLLPCYTDSCTLAVVDGFTTFGTRADDRKVMGLPILKGPPIIHIFVRAPPRRQLQGRVVATHRTRLLVGVDAAHARLVEAVTARERHRALAQRRQADRAGVVRNRIVRVKFVDAERRAIVGARRLRRSLRRRPRRRGPDANGESCWRVNVDYAKWCDARPEGS